MNELWNLLDQIEGLTKALGTIMVTDRWRLLQRGEQRDLVEKLRAAHLRMGNVLEEWQTLFADRDTNP